jgi:glycerol-3-phosphate acyltransferase PlsY
MIVNIILVLTGYLCGSITTAVILCRILGLDDPRLDGSGNPGATNVLRLHGRKAGLLALAGDTLKGVIPVLLAIHVGADHGVIALTGLAAFIGHLYPVFFGFKGGKGVATLAGVVTATSWLAGLLFIIIWLSVAVAFRYSSLASLISAVILPFSAYFILPDGSYVFSFCIMVILLFWRHQANIRKLLVVAGYWLLKNVPKISLCQILLLLITIN